jgi:hypothetical protein
LCLTLTPLDSHAALVPQEIARTQDDFAALSEAGGVKATGAFPFDYQFLAYLEGEEAELWAAASVHAGRVRGVFQGGWKYSLRITADFFLEDSLVASNTHRIDHVLSTQIPSSVSDGFPLQTPVLLPPGRYDYRIRVQDLNWEGDRSVNVKTGSVTVPAIDTSKPTISSIAIAADTGGTWNPAPGVTLMLNAAAIVYRSARPYIYYEVYGLTPGADYRSEIRLVSTWASRGQGEEFTGKHRPFELQYRGTVPRDAAVPVRSVFRLEMQDTQQGPYEVRVRVTDLATGEVSEMRRARLRVREIDRTRPVVPITEVDPGSMRER